MDFPNHALLPPVVCVQRLMIANPSASAVGSVYRNSERLTDRISNWRDCSNSFPNGILIKDDDNQTVALASTRAVINTTPEVSIFEATFQHDGLLVRSDLLIYHDQYSI